MKKVLPLISILLSFASFAQDSVKVTISPKTRDLEYLASHIFFDNAAENLYDSIKAN